MTNLKPALAAATGRVPNTEIAEEVVVCLQQGRLFSEAASAAPLEIKPLLLFYSAVGYAKAVTVGRTQQLLCTLPQSHGLRDTSAHDATMGELSLSIDSDGTFQRANDVLRKFSCVSFHSPPNMEPGHVYVPSTASTELRGLTLKLPEVLSRIPGLADLSESTFGTPAKVAMFSLTTRAAGRFELQVWDNRQLTARDSLRALLSDWCERYPCLRDWRLKNAQSAWGKTVLTFVNCAPTSDDAAEDQMHEAAASHFAIAVPVDQLPSVPLDQILSGLSCEEGRTLVSPINTSIYLSDFALTFLGLFLLSSLVRYRPQTWAHALSRSVRADRPADDRALALIEAFLNSSSIATLASQALTRAMPSESPRQDSTSPSTGAPGGTEGG